MRTLTLNWTLFNEYHPQEKYLGLEKMFIFEQSLLLLYYWHILMNSEVKVVRMIYRMPLFINIFIFQVIKESILSRNGTTENVEKNYSGRINQNTALYFQ